MLPHPYLGELVYNFYLLITMEKRLTLYEIPNLVSESDPEDEINWNISDESDYGEEIDCQPVSEPKITSRKKLLWRNNLNT